MRSVKSKVFAVLGVVISFTASSFGYASAHAASCVPKFYNVIVVANAAKKVHLQDFWNAVVGDVGDKCAMLPATGIPGNFRAEIICMFEIQGGQPPATVGLGALFDQLSLQTDTSHESLGKVRFSSVKSHARCPGGGGGACTLVTCSLGTM